MIEKPWYKKWWGVLLIIFVILVLINITKQQKTQVDTASKAPVTSDGRDAIEKAKEALSAGKLDDAENYLITIDVNSEVWKNEGLALFSQVLEKKRTSPDSIKKEIDAVDYAKKLEEIPAKIDKTPSWYKGIIQSIYNRPPQTEFEKRTERLEKFKKMSVKEHLAEAKNIYGTININQDQFNLSEQKVFNVKRHLKAISESSSNNSEVQSMLLELNPIDAELKNRKEVAALEQQTKEASENIIYVRSTLEQLKKDKNYKQNPDHALSLIAESKKKLENIKENYSEYAEASKLNKELLQEENKFNKETRKAYDKGLIQSRLDFADELETGYLRKGMDVKVRLLGKDKTTIKLEYVLFSRPLIYQLTNETGLMSTLKSKGFKKVIFDDIYNHTWKYDL
ncbi:MAG: hypothetical protein C0399_05690 [Syntrophus sp. (in: bacteria)]|nr:hypothetical protein [Syntrophus sp. (in: bacteria)]